uniref:hypothetical protein n=1 Tax=Caballeronia sp. INML3 TaxID=2921752 RepID=UPI002032B166
TGYQSVNQLTKGDFAALPLFILLGVFQSLRFLTQVPNLSEQIWSEQTRRFDSWSLFWKLAFRVEGEIRIDLGS